MHSSLLGKVFMIEIKMDGDWYPLTRSAVKFVIERNSQFISGRQEGSLSYWVIQLCLAGF